jgi:fructose-1,6-bisphosphatase/inositol monophosphatase family enzyme
VSSNLEHQINLIIDAVLDCSRFMQRDFNEITQLQNSKRGVGDFVNKCQMRMKSRLTDYLMEKRPKYPVIIAGSPLPQDSDYFFVIEPIGGLENFKHNIPFCCTSIALFKKESEDALAVVIHNPILRETFYAADGLGSWFENHNETSTPKSRMRVSSQTIIDNAFERKLGNPVLELAYLASGRLDLVSYSKENAIIRGAFKMIYESGGTVSFNDGSFIAGNSSLIKNIK